MKKYLIISAILLTVISCKNDDNDPSNGCPSVGLIESFTNSDGGMIFLYEDGKIYSNNDGTCTFLLQYFDPDFLEKNYQTNNSGTFIIGDDGQLFPTKSEYVEDFETALSFNDLFIASFSDTELYWTNFTLQSPAAPNVADYVALNKCIIAETCDFIDNKIELVKDPANSSNTVIKFTNVAPTPEMVTSKSSITSTLNFFGKDDDLWFQADFYIASGRPYSLVDFETSYFTESPGPRVVISNNQIEFENKFGAKVKYGNTTSLTIPDNQWFTLKVHLKFSNDNNGIIELWQDGIQIVSATGLNIFTSNAIQNILEVGTSASSEASELLVDNIRISPSDF